MIEPERSAACRRRLAGALLLLLLTACSSAEPPRPDVVLITLDTTRADHLGVYGYPRGTSPELDAFAVEAVVHDRAWSTAPWTLPSHASMLTGKWPTSHGARYLRGERPGENTASLGDVMPRVSKRSFRVNRLVESHRTLAEILQERGYATAAFAGGHWLAPEFGLLQGYAHQDCRTKRPEGRPADEINRAVADWLDGIPPERPMHLLVNYFDAHDPYTPAEADMLPRETLPEGLTPRYAEMIDAYDAEIRFMDRHLGALFDLLRAKGRFDDALIIVVADHGEQFGEHGREGHGPWLDEELLRVPLVVRFPGGRDGGRRAAEPVSVVDLLPLVAEEVGFAPPAGVEGRAPGTAPYVLAETRPSAFHLRVLGPDVDREVHAMIDWPWKLLSESNGRRALFRLDEDPKERAPVDDAARLEAMSRRLGQTLAALDPASEDAAPQNVSPETEDHLRTLGYIE
ncbi:MAG: sulfatase [Myxococcota bacterium]